MYADWLSSLWRSASGTTRHPPSITVSSIFIPRFVFIHIFWSAAVSPKTVVNSKAAQLIFLWITPSNLFCYMCKWSKSIIFFFPPSRSLFPHSLHSAPCNIWAARYLNLLIYLTNFPASRLSLCVLQQDHTDSDNLIQKLEAVKCSVWV